MTLTLPWTAAVFPSPPDFCSPLLLPVCQLEATSSSSSSSFSQTNLSGHNRLPLQLCCFWNGNPSALLVLPRGWQKLATKTLLFEGFICLSLPSDCSTVALFFLLSLRVLLGVIHQCGGCVIVATQLGMKSLSLIITVNTSTWKSTMKTMVACS